MHNRWSGYSNNTTKEHGVNWNEWISFSSPNRCKKKIMFSAVFLLDNKFSFYEKHYNFPNVWESVCLQKQQHLLHGTNRRTRSEFLETRRNFFFFGESQEEDENKEQNIKQEKSSLKVSWIQKECDDDIGVRKIFTFTMLWFEFVMSFFCLNFVGVCVHTASFHHVT